MQGSLGSSLYDLLTLHILQNKGPDFNYHICMRQLCMVDQHKVFLGGFVWLPLAPNCLNVDRRQYCCL